MERHVRHALASLCIKRTGAHTCMCVCTYVCMRVCGALCRFQKGTANRDSFLLTQNYPMYQMAVTAAVCEFVILGRYVPSLCGMWNVCIGAAMVAAGQAIRSKGMWTAGVSFTHVIATTQRAEHVLVTHGIYSVLRHPSYFGWFWWSVGSQIMLGNPVCTCLFAYVSWAFFADRIPYEEFTLYQFFGPAYAAYARNTHIGIPFIKGLSLMDVVPRAATTSAAASAPAPAPVPA